MKYLLTIAVLILFTAGIRAQEIGGTNNEGNDGGIIVAEKVMANGAGPNTTYLKKHMDEFKISSLVSMKDNTIQGPKVCKDDDTCGDSPNSCHSNTFLWGAISLVAGLIAFTGIRK
ncbi:MAG: hypothetical protein LWX07_04840 [Bacteroidetes bacterium]|nr:hypothetical protein [Bacteroidota bacterium]